MEKPYTTIAPRRRPRITPAEHRAHLRACIDARNEAKADARKATMAAKAKAAPPKPGTRPAASKGTQPTGKVYFYIPAAYDHAAMPHAWAQAHPKRADEAHYHLSRIGIGLTQRRHDHATHTNLNARILRNFIRPEYQAPIARMLEEQGVTERDGVAIAGQKSYGYKFTPAYNGPMRRVECKDNTMVKNILKWRLTHGGKPIDIATEAEVDQHLFKWLTLLEIDLPGATHAIHTHPGIKEPHLAVAVCEAIHDRQTEYSICAQRRRHSLVTRLHSVARPYLSINGERLVCAGDVRNSQLVFFAIVLMQRRGCALKPDEHQFVDLVMAGQLYDHLMAAGGWADRGKFKQKLFTYVFYGRDFQNRLEDKTPTVYNKVNPLAALFKSEFPNVYELILELKKDDYTMLARDMQRAEAAWMVEGVCNHLAAHRPEIPLVTVHDAIYTYPRYCGRVWRRMVKEFDNLCVEPTITKPWA